jgi:kynurenine formamidase
MTRWQNGERGDIAAPALSPSVSRWIIDRDIAVVGADNPAVEVYGEDELHTSLIRDHGVYLMELLALQGPADDQIRRGLLVVAPLLISRGAGSPVNPILIV